MNSNKEIERKYLVVSDMYKSLATSSAEIRQGYLSVTPESTVRIRLYGEKVYLTIKGRPKEGEIGRLEWEREIEKEDFDTLFPLCVSGVVEKRRWIVPFGELKIEVDEFSGQNEGLILAEIEMPSEDYDPGKLPEFMGEDVTSDHRYYNSYLSRVPYILWERKIENEP